MLEVDELADVFLRVAGWYDAKDFFVQAEGWDARAKEIRRGDNGG